MAQVEAEEVDSASVKSVLGVGSSCIVTLPKLFTFVNLTVLSLAAGTQLGWFWQTFSPFFFFFPFSLAASSFGALSSRPGLFLAGLCNWDFLPSLVHLEILSLNNNHLTGGLNVLAERGLLALQVSGQYGAFPC
jgi:hypothetical protein